MFFLEIIRLFTLNHERNPVKNRRGCIRIFSWKFVFCPRKFSNAWWLIRHSYLARQSYCLIGFVFVLSSWAYEGRVAFTLVTYVRRDATFLRRQCVTRSLWHGAPFCINGSEDACSLVYQPSFQFFSQYLVGFQRRRPKCSRKAKVATVNDYREISGNFNESGETWKYEGKIVIPPLLAV